MWVSQLKQVDSKVHEMHAQACEAALDVEQSTLLSRHRPAATAQLS